MQTAMLNKTKLSVDDEEKFIISPKGLTYSEVQQCIDYKYLQDNSVAVPSSHFTVSVLANKQLEFTDKQAEAVFKYRKALLDLHKYRAELFAKASDNGKDRVDLRKLNPQVQKQIEKLEVHSQFPLSQYQRLALAACIGIEGYALFMEQGTGKTPIVIARVCNEAPIVRRNENRMYRALIICPKAVQHNWLREFQRFTTRIGKVSIINGVHIDRISQIVEAMVEDPECCYTTCIISYDSAVRTLDTLCAIEWDLTVLDESHYIKSISTKRAKSLIKLRDKSRARMVLTGTPIANTPLDLYSQLEFLYRYATGCSTWTGFQRTYGVYASLTSRQGTGFSKLIGMQNVPKLRESLALYSFQIDKKRALPELPEKVYDTYEVEMAEDQAQAYYELAEKLRIEIRQDMASSRVDAVTVQFILVKLLRLAQICAGFISYTVSDPDTDDPKKIKLFTDPKLDAILDILAEKQPEQKTIIWSSFIPSLYRIADHLKKHGYKVAIIDGKSTAEQRLQAEHAFNCDPETRVFIGNPAAAGVGLNLLGYPPHGEASTYCDHVIYHCQNWSMTHRLQSEDRAHRIGAKTNVRITDLVVPETIDEEIRVRVLNKQINALTLRDVSTILEKLGTK